MHSNDLIIRTSNHLLTSLNPGKLKKHQEFLKEYRRISSIYLDYIWNNGINLKHKDNHWIFDTKTKLDCPAWLSTVEIDKELNLETWLSGRIKKCIITQVLGIVRGDIEKQRKRQFVVNQIRANQRKVPYKLRRSTRHHKPVKPDISNINPELNSLCLDYQEEASETGKFDSWLRLSSYDNRERGLDLKLPINHHRHSRKLEHKGIKLNSYLLKDNSIDIRWNIQPEKHEKTVDRMGADQGLKTVLTLSDGQVTPDKDIHDHSLESIILKMCRKKEGSKSFKKAQEHRLNFINWTVNQLVFCFISVLCLEQVKHLKYKNKRTRRIRHWCYPLIREKVVRRCVEQEVLVKYNQSAYMSQRCSQCGLVLKSNRTGKTYSCSNCGYIDDSDRNAANNHQQELCELTRDLRKLKLNIKGFFWKSSGIYHLNGEELAVPLSKN